MQLFLIWCVNSQQNALNLSFFDHKVNRNLEYLATSSCLLIHALGTFLNYVSIFLPIFDQLSTPKWLGTIHKGRLLKGVGPSKGDLLNKVIWQK